MDSLSSSMAAAPAPEAAWYVDMVMRLIRRFWCRGHSGVAATMATQFGFAMMPLCLRIAPALISGTTSGTSVFMRKADELSTTTAPARTAAGAKRFDCAPPAENSAMSTPSRLASVSSCTAMSPPRNFIVLPAERAEASRRSSTSGNLRCSRHCMSSTPTAPVAPAMATTGFLMLRSVWSVDDIFLGSK